MRLASVSTSLRPSAPRSSTANSSPPSRATRSVRRNSLRMRAAVSISSESPAAWPSVSFTALKSSRSIRTSVNGWWPATAVATASSISCENVVRLPTPVSGSWWARNETRSSARLRSVMSTMVDSIAGCPPTVMARAYSTTSRSAPVAVRWRTNRSPETAGRSAVPGTSLPMLSARNSARLRP